MGDDQRCKVSQSIYETYIGAFKTPKLIGREAERAQVVQAILQSDDTPCLIYITVPGGIGKTRFLEELLKNPPNNISLKSAHRLIDLYHTRFHTLAGLVPEILDVLDLTDESALAEQTRPDQVEKIAKLEALASLTVL